MTKAFITITRGKKHADRGEFYWLVSLVESVWVGSTQREACDAVRDHVRVELRQRTSDCTRVQLLLLE